jgi:two-component system, chemotaxis family, chemotaxis protein CheY
MAERVHILVVEDDPDLRDTLTEVLEAAGYSVANARDGLEALSELRTTARRPDLILLDLQMPNMDGIQFRTAQMQAADIADIPVAILTADTRGGEQAASLKSAAFLRKPLKLPQLLSMIPEVIERHAAANGGTR